jgi:hypothetical protein
VSILAQHFDKWTPEPNTGCYLWTGGVRNKGSGRPTVYANGKMIQVSRLICEEAYGPPPTSKHHAAHNTPNGCVGASCVNEAHLRWATAHENQMDIPVEIRRKRVAHEVVNRGARYSAMMGGFKTYESDNPCPRGHVGLRYVRNGACRECEMSRRSRGK